ncbi:tRNA (uridine(54)-C5)-methyltransferase TrmA [Agarivorans sp. 1_MG-2023]|uniref:tRNA (uridine(54)-C5)-methyltransferase TrmA n=1 Tax=Agarivorans sp. 1_MG-2023 TaxID=3062634 RepID=UPI0026E326AA|nr:tRNA (uridine(54)-C5)-methyltransferase TrmA [Agarivorans sp. 1_MG-2023]MDO6765671.1 tRNA (uridine(54)-C5)-methyltransferase TrmA [Agarivorans sp. 1_MG-2023]
MSAIAYYPEQYQELLAEKVAKRREQFAEFSPPEPSVFASPTIHYRMRAEFRVWHEGDDLYYIMFDQKTKQKFRVDTFPPASEIINQLMPLLVEKLKSNTLLRHKLFQVDFLSTLSGEAIVSLLYHKPIDESWRTAAEQLKAELSQQFSIQLIGRSRKQKMCLSDDRVDEVLRVNGEEIVYQQIENSFTQPNAVVNQHMLDWAQNTTRASQGDLLELYCGNGNFSLALAKNFNRVLATEIAKPSVQAAQYNIKVNQIDNVKILRLSAEEFTQAMLGEREFRRLQEADVDLSSYQCDTILVDPPRAGLDDATLGMVQAYDNIVYISCNPNTLYNNLSELSKTHQISHWALFDQFPYTDHIEVGVYLQRR